MTITDVFEALRARGLARSLPHFSQECLSRKPNYACDTGLPGAERARS